jgi:PAS domain S-box-containing protein
VLHSGRSISLQLVRHDGPSSLVVAATRKVGRGHSFAVVERFDADGLWTLHLAEPASGADATAAAQARWILAAGFGMTLLATLLLYVLLSARDRALRLIAVKTDELRRMAVIVESSDSAIVSTTPDLVVTSWNSGAERLFGRRSDDTIGVSFEDALPADGPGTFDVLREVGAGARVADYEATIRRRDGAVVVVSCVASPIMDSTGDVSGIAWIAHDITERRRLQTELRHAQKLESIGQLAAGIAHEINTPTQFVGDNLFFLQQSIEDLVQLVTRVDQETRRLAERDPDVATDLLQALSSTNVEWLGSESTAAVAQAREGVARVSTIVRAMKAFGHVSDEDKVAADLNEAIRNTLIVAANEIKHVADVETELGELPPLWCHIGDINQVLLNLIVNAVQAIAARDDGAKGTITVRTRLDGDDAVIEVADTGVGITPDIADRVFEPFFTTKEVGVGTGQGLALVYGLVRERHGGSITFTTEPNVGTTFTVRLPRSPESPRAPRKPRSGVPG